jgi:DNA (cytosine-5)-methyltransferase 1
MHEAADEGRSRQRTLFPVNKPERPGSPLQQSDNSHGTRKALSLFSSAGIGDLGVTAAGIDIVLANELLPQRVALYRANFPHRVIEGDVIANKAAIIEAVRGLLNSEPLFLVYATPPCQGMSSNGMGKLKSEVAAGRRGAEDQRNRLIIPTMDIVEQLRPIWLLLENVPAMATTAIRTHGGKTENIIDYVKHRLGDDYDGAAEVIACEDFGIPQRRKRMIAIFTRDATAKSLFHSNGRTFFPPSLKEPKRTLRDSIHHLPSLDARPGLNEAREFHPYHFVPIMAEQKHLWVKHTREGQTAFNNQCINPKCRFQETPGHRDILVDGKWVSAKDIPLHCAKCGALLPRPHVIEEGAPRLMRGFHSAYRRMLWDEPARTLTQNFIYEASDNKVHPSQNRVLSIYEAMIVQTISRYQYAFQASGAELSAARIAEVIGESVPPYIIEKICRAMVSSTGSHTLGSAAAPAGSTARRQRKSTSLQHNRRTSPATAKRLPKR